MLVNEHELTLSSIKLKPLSLLLFMLLPLIAMYPVYRIVSSLPQDKASILQTVQHLPIVQNTEFTMKFVLFAQWLFIPLGAAKTHLKNTQFGRAGFYTTAMSLSMRNLKLNRYL